MYVNLVSEKQVRRFNIKDNPRHMKFKFLYLFLVLMYVVLPADIYSQNYMVAKSLMEFVDTNRENRKIPLVIYYPSESEVNGTPLSTPGARKKFPVIAFGHGYLINVKAYENLSKAIVPFGYIMVFPDTETGIFPSHLDLGLDMSFALEQMKKEGANPASIFYSKTGEKSCLMGHSMGGGSAILGARNSSPGNSIVLLAPFDTKPSAIEAAGSVSDPTLILVGSNDRVTVPLKHSIPIFESLQSSSKTYISIKGGNHCKMANKNFFCKIAEKNKADSSISRYEQHTILFRYIIPWLEYTLKDDRDRGREFDRMIKSDSSILFKRSGTLISSGL
jgi:hypothetical protein